MIIRITYEETGDYSEVRISDHPDADDMKIALEGILVCVGYHHDTVKEMFSE